MRLLVVRHGPTVLNDAGRLRGWMDPPLTAEGLEQAEALRLPDLPMLTSDLKRAAQTALAAGRRAALTPALRPWNVGSFAGQPTHFVHPKLCEYVRQPELPVPFGESWEQFERRFLSFLKALRTDCVLFTHFRNLRVLTALRSWTVDRAALLLPWEPPPGATVEVEL
jgi:broad specificity phosphatase PhoE